MSNLVEIQLQICKLQKQAQLIKTRKFAKSVQDIREKMHAFGITVEDLQSPNPSKPGAVTSHPMPGKKSVNRSISARERRHLPSTDVRRTKPGWAVA